MSAPTGAGPADPERRARIAWARIGEPDDKDIWAVVGDRGHVRALEDLVAGRVSLGPARDARARSLDVDRELEMTRRCRATVLVPGDATWPDGMDDLERPPHCLWVRGDADLAGLAARSVAVVGARAATAYGIDVAREIGWGMSDRGFTVVSGAAFGIDAAAHEGSLGAGGPSVAFLACGIDRDYPAAHRGLIGRVAESGAVVTELPPGSAPLRLRFLARNRLIAAFAAGTVVVEAGRRSGSLNTARHADELSRLVGAVPGPVHSAVSAGCHELVRDKGAALVTDAEDVADLVGGFGVDAARPVHVADADEDWSELDRVVFGVVPVRRPVPVDAIITAAAAPAPTVIAALSRLEVCGVVRRSMDGWQKVPAPR